MGNEYVRNPKGIKGFKYGPSEQDEEDFEQEKRIQEWLKQSGAAQQFDFQHINRKGNARNTVVRAQVRLDAQTGEDTSRTFADITPGSDGRDFECRLDGVSVEPEPLEKIYGYLSALGFNQGEIECLVKMLKLSIQENKSLFEKLATDSEW